VNGRHIALWGYAGAGKDEAARELCRHGWVRVSFADKLREFALALDPAVLTPWVGYVRLSELVRAWGWEQAKRDVPEVRELLQRLGTDAGRKVLGENVWVDAVMGNLPERAVFTDCRFRNEADAVRARGGLVVAIDRPGCGPINGHVSETALAGYDFDARVVNDGTVAGLHAAIREVVAG